MATQTGTTVTPYFTQLTLICKDPQYSYRLKKALLVFDAADPVDALDDARLLHQLQIQRCVDIGLIDDAKRVRETNS